MLRSTVVEAGSFSMNTAVSYKVFGEMAELATARAKSELSKLENKLSRFRSDSEISKINLFSGKELVRISCDTYKVLSFALLLSEISNGQFDITVGALVDLWDYKHSSRVPETEKIQNVLSMTGFHDLLLNSKDKTAGLRKAGQSIDLGGVGKGYASERFIKILHEYGVASAFINIGGNVSTLGNKPDGSQWSVGIRHPRHDGCLLGAVKVTGKAVVTSGDYERYFIDRNGKRWHHILDPATGYPAESGLISVTVVADSALTADGLSTAIFVSGIDGGLAYLAQFPGTEAVLVDRNQQVFVTQGLKECYQAVDGIKPNII